MNQFKAQSIVGLTGLLEQIEHGLSVTTYFVAADAPPLDSDYQRATKLFEWARQECEQVGLWETVGQIELAVGNIADKESLYAIQLGAQVGRVKETLVRELSKRKFLYVPADRSQLVDNDSLFGEAVKQAFPSAHEDIREAGNCLAADCNTAAVFHLMRAVEWGLRALAADLGVLDVPRKSATIPIEYAEWNTILGAIDSKIKSRIESLPPGPRKQAEQDFYPRLSLDVRSFKEAFRNHVMHTRRTFTGEQAKDVLDQVKTFMSLLATRIKE